jgi:prepilin-type N-terminal cleavage/methylation domain-containing protein
MSPVLRSATPAVSAPPSGRGGAGFTLIEVLLSLIIGVVIVGLVYQVMIAQGRAYGKQREVLDARESVRAAAGLLGWELRHAGIAGNQVIVASADSVRLRSIQGLGIVCAKHPTLPRYALWRTSGDFAATADDSVQVYNVTGDAWQQLKVSQVGTPGSLGVSTCAWPGARAPDLAVELSDISAPSDTAGILVGSPMRTWRSVAYAEYEDAGRYWLGRRIGSAAFEKLTGPLLPPGGSSPGLAFTYYDASGATTTTPSAVATVEFVLQAQSLKQSTEKLPTLSFQTDSVRTRVVLRR